MLIEVVYKNGSKDRRLCSPSTTVVEFVRQAEAEHASKIQSMRVVKRNEHQNRGDDEG
jgi:hypothetical protein